MSKIADNKIINYLTVTPFWLRAAIAGFLFFVGFLTARFSNLFATFITLFLIFLGLGAAVWTFIAAFRKVSPTLKSKTSFPRWARISLAFTIVPLLWLTFAGIGTATALAFVPYSAAEIAEKKREEAQREADKKRQEQADSALREAEAKAKEAEAKAKEAEAKAKEAEAKAKEAEVSEESNDKDDSSQPSSRQTWEAGMESRGWVQGPKRIWFKWADSATYSCGNANCAYAFVAVEDACYNGVVVEAAIMEGDLSVGNQVEVTSALIPDGNSLPQARILFEDYTNSGTSFRVTDIFCAD